MQRNNNLLARVRNWLNPSQPQETTTTVEQRSSAQSPAPVRAVSTDPSRSSATPDVLMDDQSSTATTSPLLVSSTPRPVSAPIPIPVEHTDLREQSRLYFGACNLLVADDMVDVEAPLPQGNESSVFMMFQPDSTYIPTLRGGFAFTEKVVARPAPRFPEATSQRSVPRAAPALLSRSVPTLFQEVRDEAPTVRNIGRYSPDTPSTESEEAPELPEFTDSMKEMRLG